jgi:hypothetical protein
MVVAEETVRWGLPVVRGEVSVSLEVAAATAAGDILLERVTARKDVKKCEEDY